MQSPEAEHRFIEIRGGDHITYHQADESGTTDLEVPGHTLHHSFT